MDREKHSIVEFKEGFLLASAGNVDGDNKSCEVYSVEGNSWKIIAPLNNTRTFHCSFSFDNKFVYVYGGECPKTAYSSIEKIELDENFKGSWSRLKAEVDFERMPFYYLKAVRMNTDEVMILGYSNKTENRTNNCGQFNKHTEKLEIAPSHYVYPGSIFNDTAIELQEPGRIIAEISNGGTLHLFNGSKWIYIKSFIYGRS